MTESEGGYEAVGRGMCPIHALFLPSSSPAVPPMTEYPRALCLWRLGGSFLDLASCDKQPTGIREQCLSEGASGSALMLSTPSD